MRLGSNTRRSGRDYSRRQFGQAAAGIVLSSHASRRDSRATRARQAAC
jgi:hypothetical protein